MGQTPSSSAAIQLLQELEKATSKGSINNVRSFNLGNKTIILVGERHEQVPLGEKPLFVDFLRRLDCTEVVDVFVEDNHYFREDYRFKRISQEEADAEAAQSDAPMSRDSLVSVRRQAKVNKCDDKIRTHAVDVRDNGYQQLDTETGRKLNEREVRAYALTLLYTELEGVVRMVHSSARKSEYAAAITGFMRNWARSIGRACEHILDKLGPGASEEVVNQMNQVLFQAHSELVDIYTFARMLRRDNSDLLIFYGGSNHADRLYKGFLVEFKHELKNVREHIYRPNHY